LSGKICNTLETINMIITTYDELRKLEPPTLIYDLDGEIEDIHYLDSVIPPICVVHYTHGNALQQPINTKVVCYYHDVEVHMNEIRWFLDRN
jgi:hypothetical protein